jgi:hypothetical protein
MTEDLNHFQPMDPGRINTMDPVELRYWCQQLRCTEPELKDALSKVGDHVTAVRNELAARG